MDSEHLVVAEVINDVRKSFIESGIDQKTRGIYSSRCTIFLPKLATGEWIFDPRILCVKGQKKRL